MSHENEDMPDLVSCGTPTPSPTQPAAERSSSTNDGPQIKQEIVDMIPSNIPTYEHEDDDDEIDLLRHTVFKDIKIHTAKCDVCNLHNKATLRRCTDCGWQICTPCWEARGGNGAHGVSHKFTGPVFNPESPSSDDNFLSGQRDRKDTHTVLAENAMAALKLRRGRQHTSRRTGASTRGRSAIQRRAVARRAVTASPANQTGNKTHSDQIMSDNTDVSIKTEPGTMGPDNNMYWLCVAAESASKEEKAKEVRKQRTMHLQARRSQQQQARRAQAIQNAISRIHLARATAGNVQAPAQFQPAPPTGICQLAQPGMPVQDPYLPQFASQPPPVQASTQLPVHGAIQQAHPLTLPLPLTQHPHHHLPQLVPDTTDFTQQHQGPTAIGEEPMFQRFRGQEILQPRPRPGVSMIPHWLAGYSPVPQPRTPNPESQGNQTNILFGPAMQGGSYDVIADDSSPSRMSAGEQPRFDRVKDYPWR